MMNSPAAPLLSTETLRPGVNYFSLLKNRDVRTFRKRISENRRHVNEHDSHYTYLQYACLYGLPDAVEALLENGADPNLVCPPHQCSPIMMAGRHGYFNIVEMLARHDQVRYDCTAEGTVLHAVLDGMTTSHDTLGTSFDMRKHVQCLEHLLETVPPEALDINAQNKNGHTALHLAVRLHEKSIIRLLLDHGAYIGSRCNRGNMAVSLINANVFKEYLDDCIVTNNKLPIDENYEIVYRYHFLRPPTICQPEVGKKASYFDSWLGGESAHSPVSETEPLIELSRVPELRHLLKHPVLTSFLNLKWFTIRKYFWLNFTFYVTFWLCLTLHTFVVYSPFDKSVDTASIRKRRNDLLVAICTWYPSLVLCGLFALREFFQFSVSPTRYLSDVENLLDVALLISNLLILFCVVGAQFAAVAVLLTWTELVMLINRHPSLSPNIEMYKVVCTSFIKLLAWCSMLIVAFAFSFYLLFKDANNESFCPPKSNGTKNDDDPSFFDSPDTSLFKVILMMTGEFETSSIPFNCYPGVSHVVFVLFVFLVAIVLFNLMNGLAVSDTQAIRSDAEIVGNVSRAKLIAYIEKMAIANPLTCLNIFESVKCQRCCCAKSRPVRRARPSVWRRPIKVFYEHANLFPYVLSDSRAHVLPNLDNLVDLSNGDVKRRRQQTEKSCWPVSSCSRYTDWSITTEIMNAAKEILVQRSDREEDRSCSQSMQKYSAKLEQYERRLTLLEETTKRKLNEVIELLKKRH